MCDFLERNNLLSVIRAHEAQDQVRLASFSLYSWLLTDVDVLVKGYRMYKKTKWGFVSRLIPRQERWEGEKILMSL